VTLNNSTVSDNTAGLHGGGLANSGTLTLTNSTVSGNEAVSGGGGGIFTISGTITLTDTTVSGNAANNPGGGIWAYSDRGALELTNSTVSANQSAGGGGIMNEGTMTATDSAVSGNTCINGGGGLHNFVGATATLTRSILEGNNATIGSGGGIVNDGTIDLIDTTVASNDVPGDGGGILQRGLMALINSTVSGNVAQFGGGGGIANEANLTLADTTVSFNNAGADGGGIRNSGALTITWSTIANNTGSTSGGGIENLGGSIVIESSTVSGNTTMAGGGGAIENPFPAGTLSLINTTVSGNSSVGRGAIENAGTAVVIASTLLLNVADGTVLWDGSCLLDPTCPPGALTIRNTILYERCIGAPDVLSLGGNIEVHGDTCGLDHPTDQVFTPDPLLGPLADNGGPTRTHALLPDSWAIDQIPAAECVDADGAPLTTDQRGEPRPVAIHGPEPRCDVGAFEVQSGGTGGTGGTGGVAEIALPMVVDENYTGRSGFGGPPDGPPLHTEDDECPQRAGEQAGDCHRFTWDGTKEGEIGEFFTGTFWTDGYGFTDLNGLPVEAGATDVQFYAWGAAGGEQIVFGAGLSGSDPNPPWDGAEDRETITLTDAPTMYSVPLANLAGYTDVYGPFIWASNNVENPGGFEFYVDDIQWVTAVSGGFAPVVERIDWVWNQPCTFDQEGTMVVTVTASDADTDPGDLTYSGPVGDCTDITSMETTVTCPPYPGLRTGTAVVTDPQGNQGTLSFAFDPCIDGSQTSNGGTGGSGGTGGIGGAGGTGGTGGTGNSGGA